MTYASPTDLGSALELLRDAAPCVVAGGTDIYPAMAQGRRPAAYLDISQIAGFDEISETSTGFRIGAGVTWSDLIRAPLPPAFDALKAAAREVGSVQIQNAATLAGNLCNASPAADGVPALLALEARVELASAARGTRVLPLAEFILGVRQTARAADELMTAILVPLPSADTVSAFEKLGSRRYLVISICMTAVTLRLAADGTLAEARVAVGACSAVGQRLTALERDLIGQHADEVTITAEHLAPLSPIDDVRGSGAYRRAAAAEQIRRAIRKAAQL